MSKHHEGATTIEFALVLVIFLTFLLGIVDFARMLWTWNAATEATRFGARYAVVCGDGTDANDAEVLARMRAILPDIQAIQVTWTPPACDSGSCEAVRVSISGVTFQWLSPITALALPVPIGSFDTDLRREVMRQDALSVPRWCALPTP